MDNNIFIFTTIIAGASTVFYITRSNRISKEKEKLSRQVDKLSQDLQHLEIENASIKLNPHLLKNTLQSIQFLSWQTTDSITKLSEMLNYVLYDSNNKYVTVEQEYNFLKSYINLHKIKLAPQVRFNFTDDVPKDSPVLKHNVAPLITINFIENAFIHGDFTKNDSLLEVTFKIENNHLVYSVKNTFTTPPEHKSGIGLENFKKRLELLHKNKYQTNSSPDGNLYSSHLTIKLNEN